MMASPSFEPIEPPQPSQWLFPISALSSTPSSSLTLGKELYDRARGVEFLFRLGASLQLPTAALCAAATWFHRFYMRYSIEDFHRQDVAAACIFLATKTEECGRKLRDIARVCYHKATSTPVEQITKEDLEACQDKILATEEALLEALCFDFVVENPHQYLVDVFDQFPAEPYVQDFAWCIAHDSYRTVLCVLFEVRIIAAACYILGQRAIDGPHSSTLDARLISLSPPISLPTPPSSKPRSPRTSLDYFCLSPQELQDVAEAMTVLLEFYAAQESLGDMKFLSELTDIPPPTSHNALRTKIYTPFSQVAQTVNPPPGSQTIGLKDSTPDSSHGGNSTAKTTAAGWKPVTSVVG